MIPVAALAVTVLVAGTGAPQPTQPAQAAAVRVLYQPFRLSCWSRLDTFPQNALCDFERNANDPAMRKVWEIVSSAPESSNPSASFSDQWMRLSIPDRGLNQTYNVDKYGRVQVAANRPARQIGKAELAELENTLEDMCPRLKRVKDARLAKTRAGKKNK